MVLKLQFFYVSGIINSRKSLAMIFLKKQGDILKLFNKKKYKLVPGDHVYVKRPKKFYTHHGIYAGNGKVIHFTGSIREKEHPMVRETDIEKFAKNGIVKPRIYKNRIPHGKTLLTAKKSLSYDRYSFFWNNCEHFATYCALGKKRSGQVIRGVSALGTLAAASIAIIIKRRKNRAKD